MQSVCQKYYKERIIRLKRNDIEETVRLLTDNDYKRVKIKLFLKS